MSLTIQQKEKLNFMNKLIIFISFSFLLLSCKQRAEKIVQVDSSEVDSLTIQLQEIEDKNILPGFAVSIFTKDEILYQKGFGYSNIKIKQPYTINYNRVEESPRKVIFRKGEMRYTDNDEVINYRDKKELDEEVAKYNPKGTEYYKLYQDLKVHSVYEWKLGTAMVFDTSRWHSSSWFLTDNKLPDASTEYKRAIIGFGSTDIPIGK